MRNTKRRLNQLLGLLKFFDVMISNSKMSNFNVSLIFACRKPQKVEEEDPCSSCPYCKNVLPEMELFCTECKNSLPYCIVTVRNYVYPI